MLPLPRAFFDRETVIVARELLGQRLVHLVDGIRLSGLICEVEAYGGPDDMASHAYRRTPRSARMYGPPGHAYVYLIYGMHTCLNAVTERAGQPGAVLIRGLRPVDGIEVMRVRRGGVREQGLADGPGKLCQALGIPLAANGLDLTVGGVLWIEPGVQAPETQVITTPRMGVRGDATALSRAWRYVWQPG